MRLVTPIHNFPLLFINFASHDGLFAHKLLHHIADTIRC